MRTLVWLLSMYLFASFAHGQSLAEVAEKERQRREKFHDGRIYREDDLETAGERISILGVESSNEDRQSRKKDRANRLLEKDEEWDKIFSTYRTRYESTRAARDLTLDQYMNGIPAGAEGKRIPCQRILSRWHLPGWIQHAITCEFIKSGLEQPCNE